MAAGDSAHWDHKARSKRRSTHVPNLTDEYSTAVRAAFESVGSGNFNYSVRQTKLSSAGSAAICGVGAVADSCGALLMYRT